VLGTVCSLVLNRQALSCSDMALSDAFVLSPWLFPFVSQGISKRLSYLIQPSNAFSLALRENYLGLICFFGGSKDHRLSVLEYGSNHVPSLFLSYESASRGLAFHCYSTWRHGGQLESYTLHVSNGVGDRPFFCC